MVKIRGIFQGQKENLEEMYKVCSQDNKVGVLMFGWGGESFKLYVFSYDMGAVECSFCAGPFSTRNSDILVCTGRYHPGTEINSISGS
jgi:hypothetical protein